MHSPICRTAAALDPEKPRMFDEKVKADLPGAFVKFIILKCEQTFGSSHESI
jgi:hypothetical protein